MLTPANGEDCAASRKPYPAAMRLIILVLLALLPVSAQAENRAVIPVEAFVAALKAADATVLPNIDRSRLSAKSVRWVRCVGPVEEPTEFECTWLLRSGHRWIKHRNWLAMDAAGWHLIG